MGWLKTAQGEGAQFEVDRSDESVMVPAVHFKNFDALPLPPLPEVGMDYRIVASFYAEPVWKDKTWGIWRGTENPPGRGWGVSLLRVDHKDIERRYPDAYLRIQDEMESITEMLQKAVENDRKVAKAFDYEFELYRDDFFDGASEMEESGQEWDEGPTVPVSKLYKQNNRKTNR